MVHFSMLPSDDPESASAGASFGSRDKMALQCMHSSFLPKILVGLLQEGQTTCTECVERMPTQK